MRRSFALTIPQTAAVEYRVTAFALLQNARLLIRSGIGGRQGRLAARSSIKMARYYDDRAYAMGHRLP